MTPLLRIVVMAAISVLIVAASEGGLARAQGQVAGSHVFRAEHLLGVPSSVWAERGAQPARLGATVPGATIRNPPHDEPPSAAFLAACRPVARTEAAKVECDQIAVAAFNRARAAEHIAPMRLPTDFERLTQPQQLLVLANLERVDRGLPPVGA